MDALPEPHPIFRLIQERASIPDEEMYAVFNMGIGFCAMLPAEDVPRALQIAHAAGVASSVIGRVAEDASRTVTLAQPGLLGRRGAGFVKV